MSRLLSQCTSLQTVNKLTVSNQIGVELMAVCRARLFTTLTRVISLVPRRTIKIKMHDPGDIAILKTCYEAPVASEEQLASCGDPLLWFHSWFQAAMECKDVIDPPAMTLSTCTLQARPSSRMVVMRRYGEEGITFISNTDSPKGKQLAENPYASIVFFWPAMGRQVRVEGKVEILPDKDAQEFYQTRSLPIKMRNAMYNTHPLSSEVASVDVLDAIHRELVQKYSDSGSELPDKPASLVGYCIIPTLFEFWQAKSNCIASRTQFIREDVRNGWVSKCLVP